MINNRNIKTFMANQADEFKISDPFVLTCSIINDDFIKTTVPINKFMSCGGNKYGNLSIWIMLTKRCN